jgi:ABC-2 type transport system permease protein
MRRYAELFWIQLRASLAVSMQYRVDFFLDGMISMFWLAWTLVPLYVVFRGRPTVAGWTFPEAFVVAAWFTVLRGVLEGAINPSLVQISEQIRKGTLDFVLIKPADGQFLVSTAKFAPWKVFDVVAGFVMAGFAFARMGRAPALGDLALSLVLLVSAVLVMYAMWILVVATSFWVVRLDNLSYLLSSIFDAARWPLNVFRGFWRLLFTFVIPLGLMTTYPAQAILGTLDAKTALTAIGGAIGFAAIARLVWLRAIARYTSASS